jgi:hypothetical protein
LGQRIQVDEATVIGDSVVFTTDRGFTGMDGMGFDDAAAAESSDRFPAHLAARLFAADDGVRRVYVASSDVVVTREGGWDDASLAALRTVIEDFYLFYGS